MNFEVPFSYTYCPEKMMRRPTHHELGVTFRGTSKYNHQKKEIPPKDATSLAHQRPPAHKAELICLPLDDGTKEKGVIRGEQFGRPIGSYNISEDMMR